MNKIALILTFIFLSCSKNDHYNYKTPQFFLDLEDVKAKTIKELRKMGLYITGIGEGGIDCIERVFYGFEYDKFVSIDQARELMVKATEIALEKINSDERIKPHLCNYPFKAENLKITISFTKNDKKIEKEKVRIVNFVFLRKGNIVYEYNNFEERIFEELLVESYEEVKSKVVQNKNLLDE